MLRELIHLARHAPAAIVLKGRLDKVDLYETIMARGEEAGFRAWRDWLAEGLSGDVLEIGCGTGFMFAHYPEGARVRAIDVDADFLARARERAKARTNVEVLEASAEALPFPDASFDFVISSLVFCSIPDAARAFAEARRVLRPGGELRLVEHVLSDRPVSRALMRAADPIWLHLNEQGCHMDRDTVATVREVFGRVEIVDRFKIFSDGLPAFPMVALRAHKTI
jgi:ubiquinone/menaquinone biosynthesis C-methylase UbiE